MSHLMVLFGPDERRVAELNLSRATLDALTALGLDLYALYEASEHDAGVSGDGEDAPISPDVARRAYVAVRGWTAAMSAAFTLPNAPKSAAPAPHVHDASLEAESRAHMAQYLQRFSAMALTANDPTIVAAADRLEDLQQFAHATYESARNGCATVLFG